MSIRHFNPVMVTLARESRGWTQKQLADAIGQSQANICKYELGRVVPNDRDLGLIAHALEYSFSLFSQPDPVYTLGSSIIFHRRRVKIPMGTQRRITAEVNLRHMQINRLLRSVDHEHTFPSISPESEGDNPERVAKRVRELWHVGRGPIPDLTRIIEGAGGIVELVDFGSHLIDGAHLWVNGMPPVFFMNRTVPGDRLRFSLAHEVGHAIMHHSSALDDVEEQANLFASEFLMPRAVIRADLKGINLQQAARLKKVWKVSMQALIMRAAQLREIGESTKRRLFSHLGARGYRMNEPWPIPIEEPRKLSKLMSFHKKVLELSEEALLQDILFATDLGPIPPGPKLKIARDG